MKKILWIISALIIVFLTGCSIGDTSSGGGSSSGEGVIIPAKEAAEFASASNVGDTAVLKITGDLDVSLVYAKDAAAISFPVNNDTVEDTLNTAFFVSKTEFTNAMAVRVFQWALDNGKLSSTASEHNGVDTTTVKYGERELADLDSADVRIRYSAGSFSAVTGYDNHPLVCVSWYGAIMLCNWLTEMRDSNTDNVVYSGIDETLDSAEITSNILKNGYRLFEGYEWEYTARYLGTDAPAEGDLAADRLFGSDNANWTDGYYWSSLGYASGAVKNINDETATREVAVYDYTDPDPYSEAEAAGTKRANTLGLFDISGNVWEWSYTKHPSSTSRMVSGGSFSMSSSYMNMTLTNDAASPHYNAKILGFRLYRSK